MDRDLNLPELILHGFAWLAGDEGRASRGRGGLLDVVTIAMHPLVKFVILDEQSTQLLQDRVQGPVAALTMTPSMIS